MNLKPMVLCKINEKFAESVLSYKISSCIGLYTDCVKEDVDQGEENKIWPLTLLGKSRG